MFDQKQIAEFKEAFSIFDHDSDGFLDKEDLKDMLASLGKNFCFEPPLFLFWVPFLCQARLKTNRMIYIHNQSIA
jgi:hypothetical protein